MKQGQADLVAARSRGRSASEWAMVVSMTLEDIEDSWIIQQDFWRLEHKNDRIIRDTSTSNMSKWAACYFDLDCLHLRI